MQKNKKQNIIPKFKNEDGERDFWAIHSILDFPDDYKEVDLDFSNLKSSVRSIALK